jgi:splicing factor 3B subunit 2
MAAETLALSNGVVANGDLTSNANPNPSAPKKSRETERRRRRRKQKKNAKASKASTAASSDADDDDAKENNDPLQNLPLVEVEYVPEPAELDDGMDEEFRKIFEKFIFRETAGTQDLDNTDEAAQNAAASKKTDSDSDEDEQDNPQREKGVSNKKKKLQRRMKIAELKQICARPDVVEVWDATAADPKLLVFLKSYRNTVPVPRHWCQKRKFLQGSCCDNHGAWTCRCFAMGTLK